MLLAYWLLQGSYFLFPVDVNIPAGRLFIPSHSWQKLKSLQVKEKQKNKKQKKKKEKKKNEPLSLEKSFRSHQIQGFGSGRIPCTVW